MKYAVTLLLYYVFFVWNFLMEPTEMNKPLKLIQPTGILNTQIVEKRVTHKIWDENVAYRSLVLTYFLC